MEGGDGSQANCSRLGGRRSRHTAEGWPRLGVDAARFRLESSPFPPKIGPPIRESRSGTAGDLSEPTGRAYPEVERIIRPNWMRMPHPANKNSRRLPAVVHPNILEGSRVQCWTVCRLRINSIPHPRFERGLNDPESFVLPLHQRGVAEGLADPPRAGRMVNTRPACVRKR